MQILKAAVDKVFKGVVPNLDSKYPLGELDGLTIWDQARLLEEGVEDLHGLVTANLVDVLLRTWIPIERLIDWLDQALLCLHLPRPDGQDTPREALRALGIRTATDLKLAWGEEDPEESSYAPMVRHQLVEAVGGNKTGIARIEIVLQSLENDASFLHVQAFRRHDWLQNVVK